MVTSSCVGVKCCRALVRIVFIKYLVVNRRRIFLIVMGRISSAGLGSVIRLVSVRLGVTAG